MRLDPYQASWLYLADAAAVVFAVQVIVDRLYYFYLLRKEIKRRIKQVKSEDMQVFEFRK